VNSRSEPLLWLQLVALGAIPLELVLLVLVLAGADPGPLPGLERVLAWGLGVLAPGLLLWQRPADCCSLLVVQVPAGGRTPLQRQLNGRQRGWFPRVLLLLGSALLLAVLWIVDSRAGLASPVSPLDGTSRLTTLILAVPLLTLLLWQWQQLGQALWLLSHSPDPDQPQQSSRGVPTADTRLISLGLPLLLMNPLQGQQNGNKKSPAGPLAGAPPASEPPDPTEPSAFPAFDAAAPATAVTVEPEKADEEDEGSGLDQQVD
jgi:hypothetical protein